MSDLENEPETLISVPSDLEAAMIVSALAAGEVDATTTGAYTAGFRAEAPGEVHVLVRKRDLSKARSLLADLRPDHKGETSSSADIVAARQDMNSYLLYGALLLLVAVALIRWL